MNDLENGHKKSPYTVHVGHRKGKIHRDDNLPSIIYSDGTKEWYQNGELHRNNGPAVIYSDGTQWWYQNGNRHRDGGPAITERPAKPGEHQRCPLRSPGFAGYSTGTEKWYRNGRLHRDNGPAIIHPDGTEK